MTTFDLSHLGAELDASRRSRHSALHLAEREDSISIRITQSIYDEGSCGSPPGLSISLESESSDTSIRELSELDDNSDLPIEVDQDLPKDAGQNHFEETKVGDKDNLERPYPLCLLCLTRPPSAVLLPCCHLNLCYLCAPLLIHRSSPQPCTQSTQISQNTNPSSSVALPPTELEIDSHSVVNTGKSETSIPFNLLLMKATKNHSKSRKLALGGYRPPEENQLGGEFYGNNLLNSCLNTRYNEQSSIQDKDRLMDIRKSNDNQGRIYIKGNSRNNDIIQREEAKCLVCREGIKGWLRVYTG